MNRTTFLQDVYSVVAAIPEGCVVTYGQIASLVGRPQCSRMVGQAMHNVPEELHLPCHRVVNSRGRLVPGWTEQRVLLENEGVRFKTNGFVDMKKSQWEFMKETSGKKYFFIYRGNFDCYILKMYRISLWIPSIFYTFSLEKAKK